MKSISTLLIASLYFASSISAQDVSACGPITFTSRGDPSGPLFVEDNGNLTLSVPYGNTTVNGGTPKASQFWIGHEGSLQVLTENGTTLWCDPFKWMHCYQSTPQNHSSGHNFTIGDDGLLYVSDNSGFYFASEFSNVQPAQRPIPEHLYPAFQGEYVFNTLGGLWGWGYVQLEATGCYKGHSVNDDTAPTPTVSYGSSVNFAAATAKPVALGLGAAMLGLAAIV